MTCEEHRTICQTTKSSCLHLKYLCQKTLQQNSFTPDAQEEEAETTMLILNILNRKESALEEFLITFMRKTQDPSVIQSMAKLLKLLVGDVPISVTVPFRYHKYLLETCTGRDVKNNLEIIKKYGVHLSNILKVSIRHSFGVTCVSFLEYLIDKVQGVHSNDRTEPQEQIMPGTYNPENGIAYYFTPNGCQVCKQPDFAINPASRTYDNDPVVDDKCCKRFPSVSCGGFCYMFL